ncbi:Carbamoyl-phosphate synthase small chain [subsurface metagenome]
MTTSENAPAWPDHKPTALLVLADGTVLEGFGLGAEGQAVGEVCFNTAMTGYEEILTDPSYAGQLITFTFEIMRQAPDRVAKLALINTQARPDTPEATERRRSQMARAWNGQYHAILDELFPNFVHPSRRDDAGLRRLVHDMGDDVGEGGFVRQQTAVISRVDSRASLAWIKCPTLVLTGDEDNTIPNVLSKEMADGIHGAKLLILPNCGHLPQSEQPEATAAALVEWLRT